MQGLGADEAFRVGFALLKGREHAFYRVAALLNVAVKLEVAAQRLVDIQVDLEVVALPEDGQVQGVQAAGDDEVVALDEVRLAHLAGPVVVVPGLNGLAIR